jgi:hypothetical protein
VIPHSIPEPTPAPTNIVPSMEVNQPGPNAAIAAAPKQSDTVHFELPVNDTVLPPGKLNDLLGATAPDLFALLKLAERQGLHQSGGTVELSLPISEPPLQEEPLVSVHEPTVPSPRSANPRTYSHAGESRTSDHLLCKIRATERDIAELRILISKERLTRCVLRIGTTLYHTRAIAKVREEKRLAAGQLWHGQRLFHEEVADLEKCLRDGYSDLSTADAEIERLRAELEDARLATTKLSHWKSINLKAGDTVMKQIESFENSGEIDIDALRLELAARQDELDALNEAQEDFEAEFDDQVREPMRLIEETHKLVNQVIAENVDTWQPVKPGELPPEVKVSHDTACAEVTAINAQLRDENAALKEKIAVLEHKRAQFPPEQILSLAPLFETKQKPPRVCSTFYFGPKVTKPQSSPRGPFSKYKFRSLSILDQ